MVLALSGPVWGFGGLVVAALIAGLWTLINAERERRAQKPFKEKDDEMEGLRESVAALIPTVTTLRQELDIAQRGLAECLKRDANKADQITELSLQLLRMRGLLDVKSDRTDPRG